jgi:hypothetical protein
MSRLLAQPLLFYQDENGVPYPGALCNVFLSRTSTRAEIWKDSELTIPHTNPAVATSDGFFPPIYGAPGVDLKFIFTDADGGHPKEVDPATQLTLTQEEIGTALYPITDAEQSATVVPVDKTYPPYDLRRYMVGDPATSDQTSAINSAVAAASQAGTHEVQLPDGVIRFDGQITLKNNVRLVGRGKNATTLKYFGTSIAINAVGTSASRLLSPIEDLTLDGSSAANTGAQGISVGWNQRADAILQRVRIYKFPHYGIHIADQNWNLSFVGVEVDTCGYATPNSCGIFKDAGIDGGVFNAIVFERCIVEACGMADSTAGGINMQTTTSNRGIYFNNCVVEGNFGSRQIYITNIADLQFKNLYMEGDAAATGQTAFIELSGCKGGWHGGFLTGSSGPAAIGLQVKANSEFSIDAVIFSSWTTVGLDIQGSKVRVGHNNGLTFQLDATGQIFGEVAPSFEAQKSGNQTGIVTNTFTKVAFQTENYDVTAAYDNATNYRFNPKTIGKYLLSASVAWDDVETAGDQFIVAIYRNGVAYRVETVRAYATEPFNETITCIANVTATTDYFEVFVRHLGTNTRSVNADSIATWFAGRLLDVN